MARITWKGEGASPPPSLEWRGVTFPLGQAVEVDDPAIIAKAKTASIFKVEEAAPASAGAGSAPPKPKPPPPPPPEPDPEPQPGDDRDDDDEDDDPPASAGAGYRTAHRAAPARGRAHTTHSRKKK